MLDIRADTIVLGAGMVGVGAALALQARGRDVVIVERRGEAGRETSYGNAGLIERASVDLYHVSSRHRHDRPDRPRAQRGARIDWARLPHGPAVDRPLFLRARRRAAAHAQARCR